MDLHDYWNVRSVLRMLAAEWGCPVWVVKGTIRRIIDRSWTKALADPDARKLWDTYFPNGKPTPNQYILRLGHAFENGEDVPHFLDK